MVKIIKQLAGVQDLMVGNDTLTQVRNGQEVPVTGVSGDTLPIAEANGATIRQAILDRYTKSETDNKYAVLVQDNWTATTAPTASTDATLGYGPGSLWAHVAGVTTVYICVDATPGNAVWVAPLVTSTAAGITFDKTVTGLDEPNVQAVLDLLVTTYIGNMPGVVFATESATVGGFPIGFDALVALDKTKWGFGLVTDVADKTIENSLIVLDVEDDYYSLSNTIEIPSEGGVQAQARGVADRSSGSGYHSNTAYTLAYGYDRQRAGVYARCSWNATTKEEVSREVEVYGEALVWIDDDNGTLPSTMSRLVQTIPTSPTSTGKIGQLAADANYLYYCYAANNWASIPKSAFGTGYGSMALIDDAPSDGKTYARKDGEWVDVQGITNMQPSITGSCTTDGTTDNALVLTGIVSALSLETGDVIQITGSTDGLNDKLFTVETVIDDNSIIVNYEHAGTRGNGSLRLADQTTTVTITRIAKWYNAPTGVGQSWVDISGYRIKETTYTNTWIRPIMVAISVADAEGGDRLIIDGIPLDTSDGHGSGESRTTTSVIVPNGSTYRLEKSLGTFITWAELR